MATPPTIEERVQTLEHELRGIGEIMRMESRLNASPFSALFAEIDTIKRQLEALPRTIAEMIAPKPRRKK